MKISTVFFFILLITSFSCTDNSQKEIAKQDILSIKEVGTLVSTEYTIAKVLILDDDTEWYKFGKRKIIIRCEARIKAGVDLNNLKEEDIQISDKKIAITLPKTEIISFNMDPLAISTEAEEINGFRQAFTQEEKRKVAELGEQAIKEKIKDLKILDDAKASLRTFVRTFYLNQGFEVVEVNFRTPAAL